MPRAHIPPPLQSLTDGQRVVALPGDTLGELIDSLQQLYPGIATRLCEEDGQLRPEIQVAVDHQMGLRNLQMKLSDNCDVYFLPAIGGG